MGGVIHQHIVNFRRRNFLAPAIDDFLQAACDGQIPICVHHALVAGAEPAIGIGAGIGIGVVLVAFGHVRSADDHLARFAIGE